MKKRWMSVSLAIAAFLCSSLASSAPTRGNQPPSLQARARPSPTQAKPNTQPKKPKPVEINSATAAQLKTVPGIGDAEAEEIIRHRPYMTRSHLVTKNVLTYEQYLAVKDQHSRGAAGSQGVEEAIDGSGPGCHEVLKCGCGRACRRRQAAFWDAKRARGRRAPEPVTTVPCLRGGVEPMR